MNIDRDVLLNRFKRMDDLIKNLKDIKKIKKEEFIKNYLYYLSAQRALETSINICIDIGNHIVSINKMGSPENYSEIFVELSKNKIITNDLEQSLIKMAKFRNLLGHIYMEINNEMIYDILQHNLEDFELYKKQIYAFFRDQLINEDK